MSGLVCEVIGRNQLHASDGGWQMWGETEEEGWREIKET